MQRRIRFLSFLFLLISSLWLPSEAPGPSQPGSAAAPSSSHFIRVPPPRPIRSISSPGPEKLTSLPAKGRDENIKQQMLDASAANGMKITDPKFIELLNQIEVKTVVVVKTDDIPSGVAKNGVDLFRKLKKKIEGFQVEELLVNWDAKKRGKGYTKEALEIFLKGIKPNTLVVCMGGSKLIEVLQNNLSSQFSIVMLDYQDKKNLKLGVFPVLTPKDEGMGRPISPVLRMVMGDSAPSSPVPGQGSTPSLGQGFATSMKQLFPRMRKSGSQAGTLDVSRSSSPHPGRGSTPSLGQGLATSMRQLLSSMRKSGSQAGKLDDMPYSPPPGRRRGFAAMKQLLPGMKKWGSMASKLDVSPLPGQGPAGLKKWASVPEKMGVSSLVASSMKLPGLRTTPVLSARAVLHWMVRNGPQMKLNIGMRNGLKMTDPELIKVVKRVHVESVLVLKGEDIPSGVLKNGVETLRGLFEKTAGLQFSELWVNGDAKGLTKGVTREALGSVLTGLKPNTLVVGMGGPTLLEDLRNNLNSDFLIVVLDYKDKKHLKLGAFRILTQDVLSYLPEGLATFLPPERPKKFVDFMQSEGMEGGAFDVVKTIMPHQTLDGMLPIAGAHYAPTMEEKQFTKSFVEVAKAMMERGMLVSVITFSNIELIDHLMPDQQVRDWLKNHANPEHPSVKGFMARVDAGQEFVKDLLEANGIKAKVLTPFSKDSNVMGTIGTFPLRAFADTMHLGRQKVFLVDDYEGNREEARKLGFFTLPVFGEEGFDLNDLRSLGVRRAARSPIPIPSSASPDHPFFPAFASASSRESLETPDSTDYMDMGKVSKRLEPQSVYDKVLYQDDKVLYQDASSTPGGFTPGLQPPSPALAEDDLLYEAPDQPSSTLRKGALGGALKAAHPLLEDDLLYETPYQPSPTLRKGASGGALKAAQPIDHSKQPGFTPSLQPPSPTLLEGDSVYEIPYQPSPTLRKGAPGLKPPSVSAAPGLKTPQQPPMLVRRPLGGAPKALQPTDHSTLPGFAAGLEPPSPAGLDDDSLYEEIRDLPESSALGKRPSSRALGVGQPTEDLETHGFAKGSTLLPPELLRVKSGPAGRPSTLPVHREVLGSSWSGSPHGSPHKGQKTLNFLLSDGLEIQMVDPTTKKSFDDHRIRHVAALMSSQKPSNLEVQGRKLLKEFAGKMKLKFHVIYELKDVEPILKEIREEEKKWKPVKDEEGNLLVVGMGGTESVAPLQSFLSPKFMAALLDSRDQKNVKLRSCPIMTPEALVGLLRPGLGVEGFVTALREYGEKGVAVDSTLANFDPRNKGHVFTFSDDFKALSSAMSKNHMTLYLLASGSLAKDEADQLLHEALAQNVELAIVTYPNPSGLRPHMGKITKAEGLHPSEFIVIDSKEDSMMDLRAGGFPSAMVVKPGVKKPLFSLRNLSAAPKRKVDSLKVGAF